MTPRLVAIDGPLKGSTFLISGESFSIGRKSDNTLAPADLSISRYHCVLRRDGASFHLCDLQSQNGTLLNGLQVQELELHHGDQITVGASVFLFLHDDAHAQSASTLLLTEPMASLKHRIAGQSQAILMVLETIARVAPLDSTVLITGETGTGKELAARALHDNSPRAERPFVAINCAALNETFLESELFGHERGAFTGAIALKKGKIEMAHGGTLFLDEVGEMAAAVQGKLLRVLQEREFERLGGTRPIRADIRLIAATNRDLEGSVKEGRFRQDLYFRLRVVLLRMPALRERSDDIPLLADHFRRHHGEKFRRRPQAISPEALDCLLRYHWPGNVRELESAIESAMALAPGDRIDPQHLPDSVRQCGDDSAADFIEGVTEAKREMILQAYQQAGGDYVAAAKALHIHPNSLLRLVRNLGLKQEVKKH